MMTRITQENGLRPANSFEAMVQRAQKGQVFLRKGRGFSLGELKKAGLDVVAAKKMRLMVDLRRQTIYDFNVDNLGKLAIENRATLTKHASIEKPQPVEEDAEKVEAVEAAE
jgi:ribosomal protein L13E